MIKNEKIEHINETGKLTEGNVIKFSNSDNVFFVVERIIPVTKIDDNFDTNMSEEYVARKLDGRVINEVKYNSNNEMKRFSFEDGALMKIDHAFIYGQMFKTFS